MLKNIIFFYIYLITDFIPIFMNIYISYIYHIYIYIYIYILGLRAIAIKFLKPIYFDFSWLILNILAVYFFNWKKYNTIFFVFNMLFKAVTFIDFIEFIMGNIFIVNVLGSIILLISYFFATAYKQIIATTRLPYISRLSYIWVLGMVYFWFSEFWLFNIRVRSYVIEEYLKGLMLILLIYLKEQNDLNVDNYELLTFKEKLIKKLGIILNSIKLIIMHIFIIFISSIFFFLFILLIYYISYFFNIKLISILGGV